MPRSCRFGRRRIVCWIIFCLTATSLSLAQNKASRNSNIPDFLFYGGDFDPNDPNANGLNNENDALVGGNPYGAATFQNFVIGSGTTWNVTGLFTNNLSQLNPTSAYWEVRTGVSEGNGGTLIASGTAKGSNFTQTATGRSGFGFNEFTDLASGLNLCLASGTYWFAVVPQDPFNASHSFNSNTFGLNAIGTQISDMQYFNSAFFGANYDNADNSGVFPTFSSGVIGAPNVCSLTNTSLTVTPPNPTAGQVVTLSATVTSMNNPVGVGTVTFLNGSHTLATVQLNKSNGIAVLSTRLGPGTYTFTAHYNGTNSFQASDSSPQILIVTGTEPTTSLLTATPNGQSYDFDLSVFGFGFPPLAGSADLLNLTQNNELIGTINIAGPGVATFLPQQTYSVGGAPLGVAAGDFNGDGIADLAVANAASNTVSVLLGIGDGTFQPQQSYSTGLNPFAVATGDFNEDGILDLVVVNEVGNSVGVLLGNGDGTFQPQQVYSTDNNPGGIALADFNGDGVADLAVTTSTGTVDVLLGNGDGTFQPRQATNVGAGAAEVAVADFNRDGIADIAITNSDAFTTTIRVLLGNGDGTFQQPQSYPVGVTPIGIAVGDFNNDTFADLAISNFNSNNVSILLGNGDGTFQPQTTYPAGNEPYGIVASDLNGDGILDLATASKGSNAVSILFGESGGTFGMLQTFPVGNSPFFLVAADLNGDQVPELAVTNELNSTVSILIGGTVSTGSIDNLPVHGVGIQKVQSAFTPTGNFFGVSNSNVLMLEGDGANPSMTVLASNRNPSTYGQTVTFTATVSGVGGIPTGTVSFTADGSVISGCSAVQLVPMANGSTAMCTTSALPAGTHIIVASYSGDSNFASSTSANFDQVVNQATATVSVTPYAVTYDANSHTATGTAKGVNNEDLSADLNLKGTTHTNAGNYQDPWSFHDPNNNYSDLSGTVNDVINPAVTSTSITANPPSPSQFGQTVTFTATLSGSNGGSPTGTVNFTADNAPIAGCSAVVLIQQQSNSTAVCQTSALAVGSHTVLAAYGGDRNFRPGSGSLAYVVQAAGDFTVQVNPGSITITQGFTNENQPFFPQTISLSAAPAGDYNSSVTLSCSVTPPLSSGSCTVNPPSSGSLASGSLNTTLTISAGDATPIGSYTVTVSAQDSKQVVHTANLALTVIEQTPSTKMPTGGGTTTQVNFPGTAGDPATGFSCPSVSGTGINGTEAFSAIGGVCTFTPGSITLPAPVTVTLSGCSVPVARLRRQSPIFASVFFGLPAVVLLGPLFRRHRNQRRKLQRVVILFLLTLGFLMFGFGCGGSAGPLTPTGHYYVLVQGTGPGGVTYSAVVPLTVTP